MRVIDNFERGLDTAGPDAPFLIDAASGQVWSYGTVDAFTHRFAHAAESHGLGDGARIGLISRNSVLMYEVMLGIYRSNAVLVPINSRSGSEEALELVRRFEVEVLFYEPEEQHEVAGLVAAAEDLNVELVPLTREAVDAWIGQQPDSGFVNAGDADTWVELRTTGGTTGLPKGIPFTNRTGDYIASQLGALAPFAPSSRSPRPMYLATAPLTHAAGHAAFYALRDGATMVIVGAARPAEILELIDRYQVTLMWLPPTVVYGLVDEPTLGDYDYSSLQHIIYGASPMSPGKLARAIAAFGPVLCQIYGQNETGFPNLFMSAADHLQDGDLDKGVASEFRLSAAGRRTPGTDLVILDEAHQPVALGETGEIAVDCAGVMPGYYGDDAATAASRHGRYQLTGDMGFEDADGFVHIVDRKKDMIVTGGFNVYSAEVERRILAFPGVTECAVFGVPDDKWGEAVTAVIEPAPGVEVDLDALREFCRHGLGGVKSPKQFHVRAELPRSGADKVLKRELRAEFWQHHERQVG